MPSLIQIKFKYNSNQIQMKFIYKPNIIQIKFKQKPNEIQTKAKYKSNKSQKNKHFSTACFGGLKRVRGACATPSGRPWKARVKLSRHDAIAFDAMTLCLISIWAFFVSPCATTVFPRAAPRKRRLILWTAFGGLSACFRILVE